MAGILSFTLGLETSQFLHGLGLASTGILSLSGVFSGLEKVAHGMWEAIERGGALKDLSNRTGESVGNLYKLQEALKIVGLSSDSAAPMIRRLQVALAGMDEMGQRTEGVFESLGLDMDALKKLDTPRQFETIAAAMSKLSKEQAAFVSSKIFGREGGGGFLQLMRDLPEFQAALKESAASAAVFARAAAAFDKIGDTITLIKSKIGGLFAGLAEQAAPAIQAILNALNKIDFTAIGQKIGAIADGLYKAFGSGYLWEVFLEGANIAFETLPSLALAAFETLGAALIKVFHTPLIYLQAGLDYIADQFLNSSRFATLLKLLPGGPAMRAGLEAGGFKFSDQTSSFQSILKERLERGLELWETGFGLKDIVGDAGSRLREAFERLKKSGGSFADFLARIGAMPGGPNASGSGAAAALGAWSGQKFKSDATDWEKMGFIFNRGGPSYLDDTGRRTADNTHKMLIELREIKLRLPTAPSVTNKL